MKLIFSIIKYVLVLMLLVIVYLAIGLEAIWFGVGAILAQVFLMIDQIWLWRWYNPDLKRYMTRSLLFSILLIPLGWWVLATAGSFLAQGFMLTLLLLISGEMWSYQSEQIEFNQRFLWQIQREFTLREINWILSIFTGSTIFFIVWWLIGLLT